MAALDLGLVGNIKTCVFTAVTSQIYFIGMTMIKNSVAKVQWVQNFQMK